MDDLATALAQLEPFKVLVEPRDAELGGYSGKYVELEAPDLGGGPREPYEMCTYSTLMSWMGPPLSYAFYGYHTAGMREEIWIFDVNGERLAISALRVPDVPPESEAELRAVIASIRVRG